MKQIIPFKKELPFKTKVSDITSISLEREINITDDGIVTGVFHITGDYKMNEGSINREDFSFDLPFDITLDPRYDIKTVNADIEDFYYDVKNEDTLKVNIDLFIEAEFLPDSDFKEEIDDKESEPDCETVVLDEYSSIKEAQDRNTSYETIENEVREKIDEEDLKEFKQDENLFDKYDVKDDIKIEESKKSETVLKNIEEDNEVRDEITNIGADLFSNLDSTETYTTYYVYIVKEEDTIDKILIRYGISKEDLENYNDITDIKPGDKVIIPKASE